MILYGIYVLIKDELQYGVVCPLIDLRNRLNELSLKDKTLSSTKFALNSVLYIMVCIRVKCTQS